MRVEWGIPVISVKLQQILACKINVAWNYQNDLSLGCFDKQNVFFEVGFEISFY